MLKKINASGVQSDLGFSIQIMGPEILQYKQDNECVNIDVGYDPKKRKIYVYATKIHEWNSPKNAFCIKFDRKNNIISNIKDAVKLLDGDFEVI